MYLYAAPNDSNVAITAKVRQIAKVNCAAGGTAGEYVRIGLYSGSTAIGSVWYAHINPTATMRDRLADQKPISRWETLIGTPGSYPGAACWNGVHLHMEFDTSGSSAPYACYNKGYAPLQKIWSSNFLGFIGGTTSQTASARKRPCP